MAGKPAGYAGSGSPSNLLGGEKYDIPMPAMRQGHVFQVRPQKKMPLPLVRKILQEGEEMTKKSDMKRLERRIRQIEESVSIMSDAICRLALLVLDDETDEAHIDAEGMQWQEQKRPRFHHWKSG